MPRINSAAKLEELRKELVSRKDPNKSCIAICAGTGCLAFGAKKVIASFKEEIKNRGLGEEIDIRETGCPGFCEKGTVIVVYPQGICYLKVQPEDAPEVVSSIKEKKIVERLLYVDPSTGKKAIHEDKIPF